MGARHLNLLRRWSVRADPTDAGLAERWWQQPPADNWQATRADQPWQHALGHDYHGVAWYRRRARLPRKWLGQGQHVWLRFEAAATDCRAWVNGQEVGRHAGDYVPFEFDITHALAGREHAEIVCRVDEIKGHPPEVVGQDPWRGHITKGFHDVLSLQHGGIWAGVSARATGPIAIRPNGLAAIADSETGLVTVALELQPHDAAGTAEITLVEPGTGKLQTRRAPITPGQTTAEIELTAREVHRWSPDHPTLGNIHATVRTKGVPARDEATARFAFRSVKVGGRDNRRILLNGKPLLIRGMLDWGVEPEHIAPAPTRDELAQRFTELRARGFNCVCLCMVYPPEHYYDAADEAGMLLWQIHPVWKSDMAPEHMPEYRRLFTEFLRRDRRHPSVFLVSATCEHERFDEDLGRWWWDRAREQLPNNLLQVQTGFLRWSDTERMDLWDEHTYDNTGRWLCYLDDLEHFFHGRPARPFVMGETIIGTSWPDAQALLNRLGDERPWWAPQGLDGFAAFEQHITDRFGAETLQRMRAQGDTFNLTQRKTQAEALRARPHNAGWVMNHLRDVANCQCGFTDDLGRWRFSPEQLRPFLDDRALLLRTPDHAVGLEAGKTIPIELGLSNFGPEPIARQVSLEVEGVETANIPLAADPGEVEFTQHEITVPDLAKPTLISCRATADGIAPNAWRCWAFPKPDPLPTDVTIERVEPFTQAETEPEFAERAYSDGWALECRSWQPQLPDPAALLGLQPTDPDTRTRLLVTTRLTNRSCDILEAGGRVILLASKAAGSPPTNWVNLYGQVPLLIEQSDRTPNALLGPGESGWLLDTLGLDLNRNTCRAVPADQLGIADAVDPAVRLVFTHDKGHPESWDQLFTARVGAGLLTVSTLDHDNPAGRYLLHRLIKLSNDEDTPAHTRSALDPEIVRAWATT